MIPYLPPHLFDCANFGIEFLNNLNFDARFDFELEFMGIFDYDNFAGDVDYDGISVSCTRDNEDAPGVTSTRKNGVQTVSTEFCLVKKSCWYLNYLKPGETPELVYDLTSSDQFGEFQYWFRMSLDQMEKHTKKLLQEVTCHSRAL